MKLVRLMSAGIAAVMAAAVMNVGAFAEEGSEVVASVYDVNNKLVEITQEELEAAPVQVETAEGTIEIGIPEVSPCSTTTGTFEIGISGRLSVSASNTHSLSFSLDDGVTKYTPHYYYPASGCSSITYTFTPTVSAKGLLVATVYCSKTDTNPVNFTLKNSSIYVQCQSLTTSANSYATLYNNNAGKTLTGTCTITN